MRTLVATCVVAIGCGNHGSSMPDAARGDAAGDVLDAMVDPIDANEGSGVRVGGTAVGVRTPVVLTLTVDTKQYELVVSEDGTFRFPRRFMTGTYAVAENSSQCEVVDGSGSIGVTEITSVTLYCIGVVELSNVTFTPGVIALTPAFDPNATAYTATRPLFMIASDLIAITPFAAYPSEATIAIDAASATSGQPLDHALGTGTFTIDVGHVPTTSLARQYTIATTGTVRPEAYVKASDSTMAAGFSSGGNTNCPGSLLQNGNGVAISGDLLVVGAPCVATRTGAAYVYRRTNTTWQFEAKLQASVPAIDSGFGSSVAIDGTTIVIGAPLAGASAAYVFVSSGTTWSQQAVLKGSNTEAADQFGLAVAIAGDTAVVGAPTEDGSTNGTTDAGAVYVFTRSGTAWGQQAVLRASNADVGDGIGWSVGISLDTVVAGAIGEDGNGSGMTNNSAAEAGAAYVYVRAGTAWSQQAYLKASNAGSGHDFGISVSIDGDLVAVGAPREDGTQINSGAAYVFLRSGASWSQDTYVKAPSPAADAGFGMGVAIDRTNLLVGAPRDNASNGGAYAFIRAATWDAGHAITATNPGLDDRFGASVAVDRDTIVIGAFGEDSNATGVGGDQLDNSAPGAGAVYMFR